MTHLCKERISEIKLSSLLRHSRIIHHIIALCATDRRKLDRLFTHSTYTSDISIVMEKLANSLGNSVDLSTTQSAGEPTTASVRPSDTIESHQLARSRAHLQHRQFESSIRGFLHESHGRVQYKIGAAGRHRHAVLFGGSSICICHMSSWILRRASCRYVAADDSRGGALRHRK